MAGHTLNGDRRTRRTHQARARSRAAAVSIVSNTLLIVLKIVAGVLTGSVAILTEALHSAIDLLASFIAFFSVRRAEEPADASHRYGHEKFENAAAAAEGMLILAGSAVIAYAAIRALIHGPSSRTSASASSSSASPASPTSAVSSWLFRRARETNSSPALEGDAAHLRTDAYTSIGVLVGLGLVGVTGADWLDPVVALIIAAAIVVTGIRITMGSLRVLVDEALPDDELEVIRARSSPSPTAAWSATTSCAPARRARAATSTCTSSSCTGTHARGGAPDRRTSCRTRSRPTSAAPTS